MEYPNTGIVNARDEKQTKGLNSSGIFVMPGKYQLSLSKNVNGSITKLDGPIAFEIKTLDNRTIPAENRKELVEFKQKAIKLNNAISAVNNELRAMGEKPALYKAATKGLNSDDAVVLLKEVIALENRLAEIQTTLNGDRDFATLDLDEMLSLRRRAGSAIYDIYNSTSNIPGAAKANFKIAADEFAVVLKGVEKLKLDFDKMDTRLDELGAPLTSGRLPK